MTRLIHLAEIPALLDDRGDEFVVTYEDGSGTIDRNPHSLRCQYTSQSPAKLVDLMERCVSALSARKPFYYDWSAGPEWEDRETDIGKRIYDYAAAANLPAKSYQVDLSDFLLSSYDGLEALRKLCGPKDEIETEMGSIDLPEKSYANIFILTTAAGHRLELEASYPPDLDDLAAKLGVRFVPKSRLKKK